MLIVKGSSNKERPGSGSTKALALLSSHDFDIMHVISRNIPMNPRAPVETRRSGEVSEQALQATTNSPACQHSGWMLAPPPTSTTCAMQCDTWGHYAAPSNETSQVARLAGTAGCDGDPLKSLWQAGPRLWDTRVNP